MPGNFPEGEGFVWEVRMVVDPWGEILLYTTIERYQRWYSYARWGNVESLVGIVKSQSELGFKKEELLACAWTAFRSNVSFRSFRWVIKAFFLGFLKI